MNTSANNAGAPAKQKKDLILLASLFVLTGGLLLFLLLAAAVQTGGTREIDATILRSLREITTHPDDPNRLWAEESVVAITSLGSVLVMVGLSASVMGLLLLTGRKHAGAFLLATLLGALLLNYSLKSLFARPRPDVVRRLQYVPSPSFPSGHALISTAVYSALGVIGASLLREGRLKLYVLSIALSVPFLVGISRVYLGVHYATDVVAGWTAGLLWAILCWLLVRFLQRRHLLEQPRGSASE